LKPHKTKRLLITIGAFVVFVLLILWAVYGLEINNADKLQEIVANSGIWGFLAFIGLNWLFMLGQFLPTAIVNVVGVYAFGFWQGLLLNMIAVLSGAILLFILGRKLGTRLVKWIAGGEDTEKWRTTLTKGKYTLFLLFLFPASPDSLLYVLAGTSNLKFKTYLLIILLSKPIGILTTCLLGGGMLIPLKLSYLWLWILAFALGGFALWYSTKNQDKIDKFLSKFIHK
jgi:uncharacterized membrane protein YdjX (TVP38/TMEM64 family)